MASSANSTTMPTSHLRLAAVDGSALEGWRDRPRSTLVTFTMTREEVEGCWHGMRNMLSANTRMLAALDAVRAGRDEEAEGHVNQAFSDMATANAFAAKVFERVKKEARRKNRRA